MTKKELLEMIKDLDDNAEILVKGSKDEYVEPFLDNIEVVTETYAEWDRSSMQDYEFSRVVRFFGDNYINYSNKRKIFIL